MNIQHITEKYNRKPITVKVLYENPDLQGWMYTAHREQYGLDPWTMISGVDKFTGVERYILEFGVSSEKEVDADYIVFIK